MDAVATTIFIVIVFVLGVGVLSAVFPDKTDEELRNRKSH